MVGLCAAVSGAKIPEKLRMTRPDTWAYRDYDGILSLRLTSAIHPVSKQCASPVETGVRKGRCPPRKRWTEVCENSLNGTYWL